MDPNLVFWGVILIIEVGVILLGLWLAQNFLEDSYAGILPGDAAIYSLGVAVAMIIVFLLIWAFVYITGLMETYNLEINPITRK